MSLLLRGQGRPKFKLRPTQFEQGTSITVPAPYGGLNLRDDINGLRPNEARILENWLPTNGEVSLRPGNARHSGTIGTGEVETLAGYVGLSSSALIAAAGGKIYNVPALSATVTGATNANPVVITTSAAHGFSNGQTVYFAGVGGMTDLNGNTYTVANVASTTFELSSTDGTAFGVFTSDGTASIEGIELATGFSEDRWQTALYNNQLFLVNGTDNPQDYDGSAIAATAWTGTGLTDNDLINVALVRNRLWFCEKDSADVWYAGIGSITGALTKFQLSQIAEGGICMAIGSWSRDAGDGADDFTCFVMSTGEIILYQGDPAVSFVLVGRYMGAVPIGRQCLFKVGGELVIITRLGLLPVTAAVGGGPNLNIAAINPWGKIAPGFADDAKLHGDNAGWHGVLHEGVVYINVPQSAGSLSKQYVINLRNGSWTTYRGWNPSALASYANDLYFGKQSGATVNKVAGGSDLGGDITAKSAGAFVVPSGSSKSNMFTAIRPKTQADGSITGHVGVDTDYVNRTNNNPAVPVVNNPSSTPWGSEWDSPWGSSAKADPTWFTIQGNGRSVAVRLRAMGQSSSLRWFATDLMFKPGGIR